MDNPNNNVRILFPIKTVSVINNLITNFKLEDTPEGLLKKIAENKPSKSVSIHNIIKDLLKGIIIEQEALTLLQKELEISQQTAEQIFKKITTDILPFLEKVEEQKLDDPIFLEELNKKISGENLVKEPVIEKKDFDLFPNVKLQENINNQNITPPIKQTRGKSTLPKKKTPVIIENVAEEIIPKSTQSKGPDSYREPIE